MKLLLVIALCISQALGGPQFWTSIPIGDPVVASIIVPYVETARDLAVTFLDTAAKKVNNILS